MADSGLEIGNLVVERVIKLLSNDRQVLDLFPQTRTLTDQLSSALEHAKGCCDTLGSTDKSGKCDLLQTIIQRIGIAPGQVQIETDNRRRVGLLTGESVAHRTAATMLSGPLRIRKRGVESRLIINDDNALGGKDSMLIETIARGHSWFEEIASSKSENVREIDKRERIDEGDVSRMMSFAFLAPDIVEAIVDGRHPVEPTAEQLKQSGSKPLPWPDRRRYLGFPALKSHSIGRPAPR
ncbi:MAG: hypothetical protein HKN11_16870 [Rhizobiales bacterium]|nr:hypothetical protein [Hyphomicrobiales bacterium]